jgi:hypothetical protein
MSANRRYNIALFLTAIRSLEQEMKNLNIDDLDLPSLNKPAFDENT